MPHAAIAALLLLLLTAGSASGEIRTHPPTGELAGVDTSGILRDMKTLAGPDGAEKDALIANIRKDPGGYAPPVLLNLAQQLFLRKEAADAYFWFNFGRLRGRYDAARCADESARQGIDELIENTIAPDLKRQVLRMKPEELIPFAKRVLQLDRETPYGYDPRWLNLHGIDAFLDGTRELSLPKAGWPKLLRAVRDDYMKGVEEAAAELKKARKE